MNTVYPRLGALLAIFVGLIAISLPAGAAEIAGRFQFVTGDVRVQSGGVERPVVKGDVVREGDTIISGASGEAQLRMVDDAFVAIRRDTQLRLDQYNYRGRNDGTERGVLSLVRGTFRALTGLIVRANKDNYQMKTAVSTIGIRGTGNITNHNPDTNVTTNHTVTGSHSVASVSPDGKIIGPVLNTVPGQTVQVVQGQPPRTVPTPTFILAGASKDPKEKKAEPEQKDKEKEASRPASAANAETATRESGDTKPAAEPVPTTLTPTAGPNLPEPPRPTPIEIQLSFSFDEFAALKGQLDTVTSFLSTYLASVQSAATSASNAAASASALTPVDLTTVDSKIATAQTLVSFAPSIQSSITSAQAARATAYNNAGLGNTSSTLVTAQSTAGTAAAAAAAQVPLAQTAFTSANAAAQAAQTTATAIQTALDANNITLANQLLDQLKVQLATAQSLQTAASAIMTTAQTNATTAQSSAATAQSASSTANANATVALAAADLAINTALGNVQAVASAAASNATSVGTINTALGTDSGTTAQQAYNAAGASNTTAQSNATTIAGIAAINTATASGNLASVTTLASTAQGQATTATTVNTANSNVTTGVGGTDFRDSTAAAALALTNTANTAVQGALTTATTSNTTAGTQSTSLTTAQTSAVTQAGTATTAFSTATNSATTTFTTLTAAAQVDASATNANQTVANLLSLATTAAANAQAAANLGTQAGALTAQAEYAKTVAYLALAQQIQTVIQQRDAVVTADGQLATLLASANAAKTAGDAAVTATTTALNTATTNATTVAQQSRIAQYNNPTIVSANRFTSVGVGANRLAANSNERLQNFVVAKPNTNFVLDGQKNLVESRVTNSIDRDQSGTFSPTITGADMTIVGGTYADTFVSSSNVAGSENYVALGRVTGGLIQQNGTTVADLGTGVGARSYHWIIGYEPQAGYVSNTKLTGTTTYSKIANTTPTDANGNTGTLNSATFAANFSTLTATAGVNVTIASKTLDATGGNIPLNVAGAGTPQFGGNFTTVNCTGTGCSGAYSGDLTGSLTGTKADGAGFVYSLRPTTTAGTPYTDLIQGAVAFLAGTPPALAPQPATNVVTAYLYGGSGTNISASSFQASGTDYTLDGSNNLTQVSQNPLDEPNPNSQAITGGIALARGSVTSTGGSVVDFGRWQGGTLSGTDFNGAFAGRAVDGVYHWMKGPAIGPFYLPSVLTGNISFNSTTPNGFVTDQSGTAGTIDVTSTFSANFLQQSVAFDIKATTGANTWRGVGSGVRLESEGQFFASTGGASPHNNMAVEFNASTTGTFGAVDGTLMGAGSDAAGIAFAFGQGTNRAAGTVAFTGAAQSQTTSFVPGIVAAGKLGIPLSAAGAPTTGTTTLASLDPEMVNAVEGMTVAASRISRDGAATPQVVRFDSSAPIAQPTGCSSAGTACTTVSRIPAQFTLRDGAFPLDTPPGPGAPALPTTLTNTGSDATTGITWGRYVGFVAYADRIPTTTGTGSNTAVASGAFDARTSNWHGIWGPTSTTPPILPATGTFAYTFLGGTTPTDSAGFAATASTASLSANFTNLTATANVTATINGASWVGTATNVPIVNSTYFQAQKGGGVNTLAVTYNGSATGTAGRMVGIFTGNAQSTTGGAMLGYSLNQGGAAGTTMQGVAAFKK